jgi:hypothetical protein
MRFNISFVTSDHEGLIFVRSNASKMQFAVSYVELLVKACKTGKGKDKPAMLPADD